jgi:CheY-like chemotaxis protein
MVIEDRQTNCRILIIDNEPMSAKLLDLVLTRTRNDQVAIASSGMDGLQIAEKEIPDIIIVRIMMNPDGYEICQQLKQNPILTKVPVLLQAAITPEKVYPTAKKVGASGYLYQPFDPITLLEARDAVLQGQSFFPMPYPPMYQESQPQDLTDDWPQTS